MPCAASPSAIAFTSSGCSLQNSAIWSNDSAVLSRQPDGGRLRHQGCCGRHGKISSTLRPPSGEAPDHR